MFFSKAKNNNSVYYKGLALTRLTSVGDSFTQHLKNSFASVINTWMHNEGGYFSGREHTFNLTFSCWTWGSQLPWLYSIFSSHQTFPPTHQISRAFCTLKHRQMGSCVIICNPIERSVFASPGPHPIVL